MNLPQTLRRTVLPSKKLASYVIRMYLGRFLGLLIGLTAMLQLLDLLAQTDNIMAADGATSASIIAYLGLRIPQLISQFVPFVALLATLLTLATLKQSSEIVIMKAIGLSPHQALFPIGVACFIIAASHFSFHETIVVKANAELDWWQDNDYAVDLPPNPGPRGIQWVADGTQLVKAENAIEVTDGLMLDRVTIYERADGVVLSSKILADFALYQKNKWTLHGVKRFNAQKYEFTSELVSQWDTDIDPTRFQLSKVRAKHLNVSELSRAIKVRAAQGISTDRLETSLLHKFSGPLSTILMPILGAVAGFGSTRRGSATLRIIGGMALGFTFFVTDNFMLAMGEFGVAPPWLAAWLPFGLFLIVGYALIFFTEEGTSPAKGRMKRKTKAAKYAG